MVLQSALAGRWRTREGTPQVHSERERETERETLYQYREGQTDVFRARKTERERHYINIEKDREGRTQDRGQRRSSLMYVKRAARTDEPRWGRGAEIRCRKQRREGGQRTYRGRRN